MGQNPAGLMATRHLQVSFRSASEGEASPMAEIVSSTQVEEEKKGIEKWQIPHQQDLR